MHPTSLGIWNCWMQIAARSTSRRRPVTTKVEKTILVDVPVSTAYNQWTQFEDFPQFMGGVERVSQLGDDRLEWVAEIAGVSRRWEAKILEQVPDQKIAWAATEGATNEGAVTFQDAGNGQTSVQLTLEYEPEGLVENVGAKLNIVENQAERDLERFKPFIESEGYATGPWRGRSVRAARSGKTHYHEHGEERSPYKFGGECRHTVVRAWSPQMPLQLRSRRCAHRRAADDLDQLPRARDRRLFPDRHALPESDEASRRPYGNNAVRGHRTADGDPRLARSTCLIGCTGESSHLAGPAAGFRRGGA